MNVLSRAGTRERREAARVTLFGHPDGVRYDDLPAVRCPAAVELVAPCGCAGGVPRATATQVKRPRRATLPAAAHVVCNTGSATAGGLRALDGNRTRNDCAVCGEGHSGLARTRVATVASARVAGRRSRCGLRRRRRSGVASARVAGWRGRRRLRMRGRARLRRRVTGPNDSHGRLLATSAEEHRDQHGTANANGTELHGFFLLIWVTSRYC